MLVIGVSCFPGSLLTLALIEIDAFSWFLKLRKLSRITDTHTHTKRTDTGSFRVCVCVCGKLFMDCNKNLSNILLNCVVHL